MRLLTYLGFVAHAVDRAAAHLLWFVPFRIPAAVLLAALFALGAWESYTAARTLEQSLPTPSASSIAAIVRGENPAWVRLQAIVSGPYYDSRAYAPNSPVVRHYYVLRDPGAPRLAVVARSERLPAELRRRTVVAVVERDPSAVASALADLPGSAVRIDPERHLTEVTGDRAQELLDAREATPSSIGDAEAVVLTGDFVAATCLAAACPPGLFEYVVTDGEAGVIVASPHAPDAIPVEVTGIVTTDRFRMRQVLDGTPLADALEGSEHPTTQLLIEGSEPMQPEVSYVASVVLAVAAALLLVSRLVGYPRFRRRPLRTPVSATSLAFGEEVPLEISGRLSTPHGTATLDREAGYLSRMPTSEAARKEWQYWGQPLTDLTPALHGELHDARDTSRLMLHSGAESVLFALEPPPEGMRLTSGELLTIGGARPAMRLRTAGVDAILSFDRTAERDRAWAELDPSAERLATPSATAAAPATVAPAPPRARAAADDWRIWLATGVFAAVGIGVALLGLVGIADIASGASEDLLGAAVSTVVLVVVGGFLVAIAAGLRRRRDWAHAFAVNAAGAGVLVALVLAIGEGFCARPVGPTLRACDPGDPVSAAIALAAAAGFACSLWATLTVRRDFMR